MPVMVTPTSRSFVVRWAKNSEAVADPPTNLLTRIYTSCSTVRNQQPKLSFNRARSLVLGIDKAQLEEVYRMQAEAEEKKRLAVEAASESERSATERTRSLAPTQPIENPNPQKAPGAGANARPGGAEADNPVLLDVAGDQFSTNADKV